MRVPILVMAALAASIGSLAACSSSNSAGPTDGGGLIDGAGAPDSGSGSDSATVDVTGDQNSAEASTDATISMEAGQGDAATDGSPAGPACLTPPTGMIAWFPGDGNANDVVGGKNGTWTGSEAYATGKVGEAFSFDGRSYIRAPFAYSGDLTVDMWVQPASAAQGLYSALIASSTAGTDPYFQFDFNGSGNLRVQAGNDAIHVLFGPADTTRLHHLAMTSQGTTITTYLDGAMVNSGTYDGGALTFTTLKLALNRTENVTPYSGLIDEVHVWNRALASTEVLAVYNSGSLGLCH